ncbi:MAG: winged helix-turn-helix domain-containing protein [Terracidiphilus sp.]
MLGTQESVFRFGDVEVREREFRLIKAGEVIPVEPKAFRVLLFLLHNPQKLITKEELLNAVWGEIAVSENSLARSIALLRRLLGEDTHEPRFIETVSTVGYRLICPVEIEESADASSKIQGTAASHQVAEVAPITGDAATEGAQQPGTSAPVTVTTTVRVHPRRRRWPWVLAAGMLAAIGITAAAWWEWWSTPAVPYVTSIEAITHNGLPKGFLVTDGSRAYFSEKVNQGTPLAQVSAAGGEVSIIATPFAWTVVCDIAPDKSSLLVAEYDWIRSSSPLWIVPIPEGAPRRVGNLLVVFAAWTPDGSQIVFIKGTEIWRANADGSQARKLLTALGPPYLLRISPDGKRMRFWVPEHVGGLPGGAIWEANTDGSGAHRLLPGWQEQPSQVAGSWSPDGRYYVFGVHARRREDLWLLPERRGWFLYRRPVPVQLTRGPLTFHAPLAFSPDGQTLFAVGEQLHGELMRSDPATHQAVPYLSGISATEEAFSPDGQWITYVTIPDFSLWRSRTDGSDRVQLTSLTGYAGIARWSPDGRRIAFEWAASGKTLKLAVISRDGGAPEQVIPDNEDSHDQNDPTWSPDGEQIIFARDASLAEVERMELLRVDLRTRKVTPVPGSEGLYSPRWSPDGRYLAALPIDSRSIHLFDFQKQVWTTWFTADEGHVGWNLWSPDSRDLYFATVKADHIEYWRIGVGNQTPMKIADLQDQRLDPSNAWPILAPDGGVLYTRDLSTYEIYALHLSEK